MRRRVKEVEVTGGKTDAGSDFIDFIDICLSDPLLYIVADEPKKGRIQETEIIDSSLR